MRHCLIVCTLVLSQGCLFAYPVCVSSPGTGTEGNLQCFTAGPQGRTPIGNPFRLPNRIGGVAIDNLRGRIYASVPADKRIYGFTLDPVMGLKSLAGSPFEFPIRANRLVIDRFGRYLCGAGTMDRTLACSPLDRLLGAFCAPPKILHLPDIPGDLTFDEMGNRLYATHPSSNSISAFHVGPLGSLRALRGSPFEIDAPPISISFGPDGQMCVVTPDSLKRFRANPLNGDFKLTQTLTLPSVLSAVPDYAGRVLALGTTAITVLGNGSNGNLTALRTLNLGPNVTGPYWIGVEPGTAYIDVASKGQLAAFSVQTDATLTPAGTLAIPTDATVGGFVPNVFSVTSLADTATGQTLRAGITSHTQFLRIDTAGVIKLASPLPPIVDFAVIAGLGPDQSAIDGAKSTIFQLTGTHPFLQLSGLTLQNAGSGAAGGGALTTPVNSITLASETDFTANTSTGRGGAVNNSGTLKLETCQFSGNRASQAGGVYNQGILVVTNSHIEKNMATGPGGAFYSPANTAVYLGNNVMANNAGLTAGVVAVLNGSILWSYGNTYYANTAQAGPDDYCSNSACNVGGDLHIGSVNYCVGCTSIAPNSVSDASSVCVSAEGDPSPCPASEPATLCTPPDAVCPNCGNLPEIDQHGNPRVAACGALEPRAELSCEPSTMGAIPGDDVHSTCQARWLANENFSPSTIKTLNGAALSTIQVTPEFDCGDAGSVSANPVPLDGDGRADFQFQAPSGFGLCNIGFQAPGFRAGTAHLRISGPPATIQITGGNNQSGVIGGRFPYRLQVALSDDSGNPVAGVAITLAASTAASGATGFFGDDGKDNRVFLTDRNGLVGTALFAGSTAGSYTVTATAANGLSVVFIETNGTLP